MPASFSMQSILHCIISIGVGGGRQGGDADLAQGELICGAACFAPQVCVSLAVHLCSCQYLGGLKSQAVMHRTAPHCLCDLAFLPT